MRRAAPGLLLVLSLAVLSACGGGDSQPRPTSDAGKAQAAAAFAKAYAAFRSDFAAATAMGREGGVQHATASVRAVRAAYFDLDGATREIDMPPSVTDDVNTMLGAIGELIAALDRQAATTTSEDFEAANPASSAALKRADEAIAAVVDALGVGAADEHAGSGPSGSTQQRRLAVDYITRGRVGQVDAWTADLLAVGAAHANHETPAEDMGIVVAWRAAFPEVLGESGVVGQDREAPKNGVSGFSVLPRDIAKEASRANPYHLAFAVRDDAGRCAGGVLSGFPDPTGKRAVRMKPGTRCSGAAVARIAGF